MNPPPRAQNTHGSARDAVPSFSYDAEVLTDLRILVVDTARVWWRLLPVILPIYLLGWLAAELVLRIAVIAGDLSAWLTLVLFAFNFVCILVAAVLILGLAGRELGIRDLLPADEREVDDRDSSLSRLVAVTLLPFLGMYAAFGQVTEAASRLFVQQMVRYGVIPDVPTVVSTLHELGSGHLGRMVALLVGLYVLRRVVDVIHDRTGWRLLGLLVVLIESFFLLVLILGGVRVLNRFASWLEERVFVQWLVAIKNTFADFLAIFAIDLPAIVDRLVDLWSEQVWPLLLDTLAEPLLWLAVAALVYGSRVLSLAELWRRGQPYAARVPGASVFARYRDKQALRRIGPPPRGIRLAADQVQQAFFGDLDDKYLPTVHSLRLVLRAGVVFLGSYVLVYSVLEIAGNYASLLVHTLTGGHPFTFWVIWEPVVDLILLVPFETLRLCLLAVAFRRCLELFAQRVDRSETGSTATPLGVPG